MNNYEVIQDNKYIRRVRITDGVILNIYKFKSKRISLYSDFEIRKQKKVYDDFYELTDNYKEFPKGTIINYKDNCVITEIIKDKKDYYYELKTIGNMFSGDFVEFESLINRVRWNIINCDDKSDVWED